jgi:hypothetical protein
MVSQFQCIVSLVISFGPIAHFLAHYMKVYIELKQGFAACNFFTRRQCKIVVIELDGFFQKYPFYHSPGSSQVCYLQKSCKLTKTLFEMDTISSALAICRLHLKLKFSSQNCPTAQCPHCCVWL